MQKHLLLVDSDPKSAESLLRILQQHDYTITVANDGTEGYALAEKLRPDCIIFDVELGQTSGTIMYSRLRRNAATKNIPAIVRSDVGPRPADMGTGIPTVTKTCAPAVLLRTLDDVLAPSPAAV